jgi:hypothetical protein
MNLKYFAPNLQNPVELHGLINTYTAQKIEAKNLWIQKNKTMQ